MRKGRVREPGTCNGFLVITPLTISDGLNKWTSYERLHAKQNKTKKRKKERKKDPSCIFILQSLDCDKLTQNLLPPPHRAGSPHENRFHQPEKWGCIQPSLARMFKCSKTNAQRQPTVFIKYQQKNYGRYTHNLNHFMPCNLCQITKKNIA